MGEKDQMTEQPHKSIRFKLIFSIFLLLKYQYAIVLPINDADANENDIGFVLFILYYSNIILIQRLYFESIFSYSLNKKIQTKK